MHNGHLLSQVNESARLHISFVNDNTCDLYYPILNPIWVVNHRETGKEEYKQTEIDWVNYNLKRKIKQPLFIDEIIALKKYISNMKGYKNNIDIYISDNLSREKFINKNYNIPDNIIGGVSYQIPLLKYLKQLCYLNKAKLYIIDNKIYIFENHPIASYSVLDNSKNDDDKQKQERNFSDYTKKILQSEIYRKNIKQFNIHILDTLLLKKILKDIIKKKFIKKDVILTL
jgi:hypothetical protein